MANSVANWLGLLGVASALVWAGPVRSEPSARRALLIGVGAPEASWPVLGTEQDLALLRVALSSRGLAAADISVVDGARATREGILEAIASHLGTAPRGAHLLLHFSGHGQRITDDDGDEPDGYDEALVTYGAPRSDPDGSYDGAAHLRDDELASVLQGLREQVGPRGSVVFTVDACHGVALHRGRRGGTPALGPPAEGASRSPSVQVGSDFVDEPVASDGGAPLVVLAAARADQAAHELPSREVRAGVFSLGLARALLLSPEDVSWRAVYGRVVSEVVSLVRDQHPQLEGDGGLPVLGGAPARDVGPGRVLGRTSDGRVLLAGGGLVGFTRGATIELHLPDGGVARGLVTDALGSMAWATVEGDGLDDAALVGATARVAVPGSQQDLVPLGIAAPGWEAFLAVAGAWVVHTADAELQLEQQGERVVLRRGDRVLARSAATERPEPGDPVLAVLHHLAQAQRLGRLELSAPRHAVEAALVRADAETCAPGGVLDEGPAGELQVPVGQTVALRLQSRGDADSFITVVHFDGDGRARQLLTPARVAMEPLGAGREWVPPVCWTTAEPLGTERLRVFATRNPVDLDGALAPAGHRTAPTSFDAADTYATDLAFSVVPR